MEEIKEHPLGSRFICLFLFPCAKVKCGGRINADGKANCNGVDKILHREYKGKSRHGVLAQLCHKVTVHNVV